MAGVEVYARWVGDDEEGRDELARRLLAFDSSDAEIEEADGDHFAVLRFPEDTDRERALAHASEAVRHAADEVGVPQERVQLAVAGADDEESEDGDERDEQSEGADGEERDDPE